MYVRRRVRSNRFRRIGGCGREPGRSVSGQGYCVWKALPDAEENYGLAWGQLYHQSLQAYAHGTWAQAVAQGTAQYWGGLYRTLLLGGSSSFLALFILGLWAARVDLVARLTRRRSTILIALLFAAVCWAGFQCVLGKVPFWWPPLGVAFTFFDHATTWASSAVYALLFALAMSYDGIARRLQPLAALGRMTLTTYLTQSLVSTFVFYNWGLGLMNRVNLTGILMFTVGLFSLQIAFSVWWLRRYQFGPAEWLWRSLAYGRRLPLRVRLTPLVAARTEISTA